MIYFVIAIVALGLCISGVRPELGAGLLHEKGYR
jgi:hypothetical protein